MPKSLLIALIAFLSLMFITYLSTIILYRKKEFKEKVGSTQYKVMDRKGRLTLAYVMALILLVVYVSLIVLAIKFAVSVTLIVLLSLCLSTLFSGIVLSCFVKGRSGFIVMNVGGLLVSIVMLVYGLINFKWYNGVINYQLIVLVLLAITYIFTKDMPRNMNTYIKVILALSLIISIVISTINLMVVGHWYVIFIGLALISVVITFIVNNKD